MNKRIVQQTAKENEFTVKLKAAKTMKDKMELVGNELFDLLDHLGAISDTVAGQQELSIAELLVLAKAYREKKE